MSTQRDPFPPYGVPAIVGPPIAMQAGTFNFGVPTQFGAPISIQQGTFGVGTSTQFGQMPQVGVANRGHKQSEELIVTTIVTKKWQKSKFEEKQAPRQYLFNVRSCGQKQEVVAVATNYQLNSLLREAHQRHKHLGRVSRLDMLSDKDTLDELVYQLREGPDNFLLGQGQTRITADMRLAALDYFSAEGISKHWNYLGIYSNDSGREHKNYYLLNVGVGGVTSNAPDNIFQSLRLEGGVPELGPQLQANDHCRFILRRRFSPATQQYEEFVVEPHSSNTRYAPSDMLEYEDYDGYIAYAPTFYVGRVVDVLPGLQDATTLHQMRGIDVPWTTSFEAHGRNLARIKLLLGDQPWNMQR